MILGIVPLFFFELFLSMKVGDIIGFNYSVLWIMTTTVAGIIFLRMSPYTLLGNIQSVKMGRLDMQSANRSSISYFIGAVLLIVPGVLSDIIGIASLLYSFYLQLLAKIRPQQKNNFKQAEGENDVIDVEIID